MRSKPNNNPLPHLIVYAAAILLNQNPKCCSAVSIPVGQGQTQSRPLSVVSFKHDSSFSTNDSTLATSLVMERVVESQNTDPSSRTDSSYLNEVRDPLLVAHNLETAANYLVQHSKHSVRGHPMANTGINMTSSVGDNDADKSGDLGKVLDGFVFLTNMYDPLVRPGQFENHPTKVSVHVAIDPWFEVDEQNNEMTVSLTLTQKWTDPRLAYESRLKDPQQIPSVTLTSSMHLIEAWVPDTYVMNEKRSYKHESADVLRISSRGVVTKEQRFTVTVHCRFQYASTFPFDQTQCHVKLASFSLLSDQLAYAWENVGHDIISPLPLPITPLVSKDLRVESIFRRSPLFDPNTSSRLALSFLLTRSLRTHVTNVFLPLAVFTLIAIASLLKPIGAQVGGAIAYLMFGLMSIFMGITFNGVQWGYSRNSLDSYYFMSAFTMLLAGILNIVKSNYEMREGKPSVEMFEMHRNNVPHHDRIMDPNRNTRASDFNHSTNPLRGTGEYLVDDDDNQQQQVGMVSSVYTDPGKFVGVLRSFKGLVNGFKRTCVRVTRKVLNYSTTLMLLFFVIWNIVYWIKNLTTRIDS